MLLNSCITLHQFSSGDTKNENAQCGWSWDGAGNAVEIKCQEGFKCKMNFDPNLADAVFGICVPENRAGKILNMGDVPTYQHIMNENIFLLRY